MTHQEVETIVEEWCRKTTNRSPSECRTIARALTPHIIENCDLDGPTVALADARRDARFSLRGDVAERLRKCLEHHNIRHARRMPLFDIKRLAGETWQYITEDLFGLEYKHTEPSGTAGGPRG